MRATVRDLIDVAIRAVDPTRLTREALKSKKPPTRSVIAIGKGAPAMTRGAAEALGEIEGICVAYAPEEVPSSVELLVGDHPVPKGASFQAGRRVLQYARESEGGCAVLISGGGSALCEWPRPGVDPQYLQEVNQRMLLAGTSIRETNTVRGHLSAIKCGGLARAGAGPFPTYILSDVAGEGPDVVASGPTISMGHAPREAREILERIGMDVSPAVWEAMSTPPLPQAVEGVSVTVLGDGKTAAHALAAEAESRGLSARVLPDWLRGDTESAVDRMFSQSESGLTIAAGETSLRVEHSGRGGRNTHAALLAARRIEGTDSVFCASATDGVDGSSRAAGGLVDGATLARGGDPSKSLNGFDSASYLEKSGDLLLTGPTGTNVADIWVLWRP